jgi:hypothetical protein
MKYSRALFANFVLATVVLLSASGCSGGHVTMVYEKGRDPKGTSAEDMTNRLGMAGKNPELMKGILLDLEKVPSTFAWATFWDSIRKNISLLTVLSAEEQEKLLDTSNRMVSCSDPELAINAFGYLVVQHKVGCKQLKALSRNSTAALDPKIVLQAMDLESPSDTDAAAGFLITEMEKNSSAWNSELAYRSQISKWVLKMVQSAHYHLKDNSTLDGVADGMWQLSKMQQLLESNGFDTQFILDEFAKPVAEKLGTKKGHKEANELVAKIRDVYPNLLGSAEFVKNGKTYDARSGLLTNPSKFYKELKRKCPFDNSKDLFAAKEYMELIDKLSAHDNASRILLDPELPCVEQLNLRQILSIVKIITDDFYPLGRPSVDPNDGFTKTRLAENFLNLMARSIARESPRFSNSDVKIFLSLPENRAALEASLKAFPFSKTLVRKDWQNLMQVLLVTYSELSPEERNKIVISRLASQIKTGAKDQELPFRKTVLGNLIWLAKDEAAKLASAGIALGSKLPPHLSNIFVATTEDEKDLVIGGYTEAIQLAGKTVETNSDATGKLFNELLELDLASHLAVFGKLNPLDIIPLKSAIEKAAVEKTSDRLVTSGNSKTLVREFMNKLEERISAYRSRITVSNVAGAEEIIWLIKVMNSIPDLSEGDKKWIEQNVAGMKQLPASSIPTKNSNLLTTGHLYPLNAHVALMLNLNSFLLSPNAWSKTNGSFEWVPYKLIDLTGMINARSENNNGASKFDFYPRQLDVAGSVVESNLKQVHTLDDVFPAVGAKLVVLEMSDFNSRDDFFQKIKARVEANKSELPEDFVMVVQEEGNQVSVITPAIAKYLPQQNAQVSETQVVVTPAWKPGEYEAQEDFRFMEQLSINMCRDCSIPLSYDPPFMKRDESGNLIPDNDAKK